jgi:hypothetical protein
MFHAKFKWQNTFRNMANELSAEAIAAELCRQHSLPDWIRIALVRDVFERIETGSDDRKQREVQKIQAEIQSLVCELNFHVS